MLNCTRPDTPALLEALGPVFTLSVTRPAMYADPTYVNMTFIMLGILDVVRIPSSCRIGEHNIIITLWSQRSATFFDMRHFSFIY